MSRTSQQSAGLRRRAGQVGASAGLAAVLTTGCSVLTASDPPTAASGPPSVSEPSVSDPPTASPGASPAPPAATGSAAGSTAPTGGPSASGGLEAVPQVAAKLAPSVVTVLVGGGNGSGVVYSRDGLILTNEHVVRGHRTVEISFADGQRVAGTVRAVDELTDLALVQATRRNLPPATFQTRLPAVGSLAVVIGAPLGFQNSVTAGVVSGVHREIPSTAGSGQSLVDLLQTDAPISPGNSGGAVADASGAVIGISEAYIPPQSGAVALGFAIPAATAVDVANQLQRTGRAQHAFAGLQPAAITPEIAQQLGVASTDGVLVYDLVANGPAERAGVVPGDIILAVNGKPTRTPGEFLAALRAYRPGNVVSLTVRRPGQTEREIRLTLADRPAADTP